MANSAAIKPIQGPQGPQGNTGAVGPAPDVTRLSTTSLAIATGSKSFTFTAVSTQLGWLVGSRLRAASQANGGNYMEGLVTAVSTSAVTISVDITGGSGSHADWNIFIIGNTGTVASRSNVVFTTGSIAAGGRESSSMPIARSFAIIAVSVDRSCRVRLYATAAQRDADVLRGTFTPPQVNTSHGVILDIVLDGSTPAPLSNFICSPEAYGANGDVVPSSSIYYTITNNTLGASTVQVTLLVKIEEV
jgi:hypothetical protein